MATKRKYGYYIKGNRLAIIQQEDTLAGSSNDQFGMYKSPTESITEGLEIEYAYSPRYSIVERGTFVECESFGATDGFLRIIDSNAGLPTSGITHVVIEGSEKFNGLHKIKTFTSNTTIVLDIPYNGGTLTEGFTVFTDVNVLEDETFELDISRYQANAVVYYLKAKIAEDMGDFKKTQYFMREFKRQMEKGASALKRGPYIMQGFKEMT